MGVTKLVLEITGIEVLTVNSIWLKKKTVAGKNFFIWIDSNKPIEYIFVAGFIPFIKDVA